jgi:hypothetical protein
VSVFRGLVIGCVAVGLTGCVSLESVTSGQIGCAESDISVTNDEMGWGSRTWTARCHGKTYFCSAHGGGKDSTPQVACRESNNDVASVAAPPARSRPRSKPEEEDEEEEEEVPEIRTEGKGDEALVVLELRLHGDAVLRLTAAPESHQDLVQLKLVRETEAEDVDECNLAFMVNGQVAPTPKAVAVRQDKVLSHRIQIGRELMAELAGAQKVAVRVCTERWALTRTQVRKIREFMDRVQEEQAWRAPASAGSAGASQAPAVGAPK